MLHILSTSDRTTVTNCLTALTTQDTLVILYDSLDQALSDSDCQSIQQTKAQICHIEETGDKCSTTVLGSKNISYDDFVDLCCQHQNITSWY